MKGRFEKVMKKRIYLNLKNWFISDTGQEMRGETYFYSPTKDEWIEGPCLNVPRKSAFSYKV